jgi:hypothetical protein
MAEKFKTYIIDSSTGSNIAGAAVYLLNSNGSINRQVATADDNAYIEIDYTPGQKFQIDFPGFEPMVIDPLTVNIDSGIELIPDASSTGEEVIVTAKRKKVPKPNYTVPIVLGSAALVTFGFWLHKRLV